MYRVIFNIIVFAAVNGLWLHQTGWHLVGAALAWCVGVLISSWLLGGHHAAS